ncbi:antibiotic biosynthesis monooxygenase [Streptosporangium sp. NPDC087985]|uniref:antibiotic biosynthesis monooxygenase n=1 Tax=Streptosporangium sp. NPDC087985 TaxID=3366196 RepID=UPI003801BBA2
MEVLVAVIAFAGALLAAIATVALVRQLREEPKGWLIAWSVTTAALCLSLTVVATGYLTGFGSATFRIYQVTGSLLAPLWLAVGVVQLVARKSSPKFASWLLGIALTVVASVIMMVDPIPDTDFTKALPSGGSLWGLAPTYVLWAAHLVVVLILLGGIAFAVMRWRDGDDYDADNMHALLALGPTGLALIGAMSFAVPGMFTALLLCVTAAAVWYVVLRPLAPYEDDDEDEDDDWEDERRPVGRRAPSDPPRDVQVAGRRALPEDSPRRSGLGDLVAEYRAGEQDVDYAARMQPQPAVQGDPFGGPATGTFMAGEYGMPSPHQSAGGEYTLQPPATGHFGMPPGHQPTGEYDIPLNEYGRPAAPGVGEYGEYGEYGRSADPAGPSTGEFALPDAGYGALPGGSLQPMSAEQAFGAPAGYGQDAAYGSGRSPGHAQDPLDRGRGGAPGYGQTPDRGFGGVPGYGQASDPGFGGSPVTGSMYPGAAEQQGGSSRPSPSIFGLLTVFTLIDGTGELFDRLAEETVEAVRLSEPDTLVYVCHSVKSAPLQRIVYELYRDEVAYTEHQRQPHVERFVSQRQTTVLATNVIELNVNAAKVMPLPTAFRI